MPKVIRKPPSKQTREERLINLKAARAARKRKGATSRRKQKNPKRRVIRKKAPIKRKRTNNPLNMYDVKHLTGGTGDVNPQFLNAIYSEGAAHTWSTGHLAIPITKLPIAKGRANVFEVLKVMWDAPSWGDYSATQTLRGGRAVLYVGPALAALPSFGNSRVIALMEQMYIGAFTALGSFADSTAQPLIQDLTDGAGHGVLIATDDINFGILGFSSNTIAMTFSVKILYRIKSVGLIEYLGIVQSQQ